MQIQSGRTVPLNEFYFTTWVELSKVFKPSYSYVLCS